MFDFEVSMHHTHVDLAFYDKPKIEWPVLAKVFLPQSFISCEMPKQNKTKKQVSKITNKLKWKKSCLIAVEFISDIAWVTNVQTRTTNAQWSFFSLKSRTFGLGQTNWSDKLWVIRGIVSRVSQNVQTGKLMLTTNFSG